jgi:LytS/YehU family sensor histidine kinase
VLRVLAHFRHSRERERRTAALELKTAELQKQLTQAQLDVLRSQLNPHFLFNTLNMISSVMYDDVERADRMLSALSRMLRMSLEADVPPCVPVRRELEFIDCAIELAKARFEQKLDIQVNCAPSAANALIPNLLVYTLIENSIKHHDFELSPNIIVRADIRRQGNQLEIEVADNGPGIANLDQAIGRGVGLTNTRERLQALYTNRHQFALRNGPNGGLHARIEIPFEAATNGTPAVPHGAIATCAVDTAGV